MGKEMKKHYSWVTAKCVRYGEDFTGENHPCYWCGKPPQDMLGPSSQWCKACGGFACPDCHRCWCTGPEEEVQALRTLRNKYCCNWLNFKVGVNCEEDLPLLRLVPGFKAALDYCRAKKGFKDG
jgi:hypothetical protein